MCKNIVACLLSVVLVFCMVPVFAQETGTQADKVSYETFLYAEVATPKGNLNMRVLAKEKSKRVSTIPNHSIILVNERGDEWSLVNYIGKTGYVKNTFISFYEPLPFEQFHIGDQSEYVQKLKTRLKELGYFPKSADLNDLFDNEALQAVNLFQKYNGLEVTDALPPELCAYILWNDVTEYEMIEGTTDTVSGFTCKLSYSISDYNKLDNGNVSFKVKYGTKISGGTEPYKIKVRLVEVGMKEKDAPWIDANPYTFVWYKGSTDLSFKLILVVTDAQGVSVSSAINCAMDIPYSLMYDDNSAGEEADNSDTDDQNETNSEEEYVGEY